MTEPDLIHWLTLIAIATVAAAIVVTLRQWLVYEHDRRITRERWARPAPIGPVIDSRRADELEAMNEALRREAWLANRRADELAKSLAAARQISRSQEQAGLAVSTMRIEAEQTGQMPAIEITETIEKAIAQADEVATVVEMTAQRRRVLAS